MTEQEFEILDELYFLQTFGALESEVTYKSDDLAVILGKLIEKGWVRVYESPDEEIHYNPETFAVEYRKYYYLASKAGLLAHNSTDG